jgi:hypothetical protein
MMSGWSIVSEPTRWTEETLSGAIACDQFQQFGSQAAFQRAGWKSCREIYGLTEQPAIFLSWYFGCPEALEMIGHELGVEQGVASMKQARDKVHESYLTGILNPTEHALTEEGPAERYAVEASNELVVLPAFHAVTMAARVQFTVEPFDLRIDPAFWTGWCGFGACPHRTAEIMIDPYLELTLAHDPAQFARNVKAIERQYTALIRIDPEQFRIVSALCHGKNANRISIQQQICG